MALSAKCIKHYLGHSYSTKCSLVIGLQEVCNDTEGGCQGVGIRGAFKTCCQSWSNFVTRKEGLELDHFGIEKAEGKLD